MKQNGSCDITHDCGREKQGAAEYSFFRGARGISIYIYTTLHRGLRRAAQNAEEASASEAQAPTKPAKTPPVLGSIYRTSYYAELN